MQNHEANQNKSCDGSEIISFSKNQDETLQELQI